MDLLAEAGGVGVGDGYMPNLGGQRGGLLFTAKAPSAQLSRAWGSSMRGCRVFVRVTCPPSLPSMRLVGVPILLLLLYTWFELVLAFGFVVVAHFMLMVVFSFLALYRFVAAVFGFLLKVLGGILFAEILVEAAVTS